MSDDLRTRIKHLLDTHRCDDCTDDPPDWTGHLADAVICELQLRSEPRGDQYRLVTDWMPKEDKCHCCTK